MVDVSGGESKLRCCKEQYCKGPWNVRSMNQDKFTSIQFSSVSQACLTLCYPMDCSMPGFPVITNSQSLLRLMCFKSMMSSYHLILCRPLLFLPSVFPSIRVFSNETVLRIRWPKYWSFSFSISTFNE